MFLNLNRMLLPDEHVVYTARLHWAIYRFGVALIFLGLFIAEFGYPAARHFVGETGARITDMPFRVISLLFYIVGCLDLLFAMVRHISTEIVVTNQRIISKKGLIATNVCEAMMPRVTSVNIQQTVMGRVQNYGTVSVVASGGDIPPLSFIADPYQLYTNVMRTQREAAKAAAAPSAPMPVTVLPEHPTVSLPPRREKVG